MNNRIIGPYLGAKDREIIAMPLQVLQSISIAEERQPDTKPKVPLTDRADAGLAAAAMATSHTMLPVSYIPAAAGVNYVAGPGDGGCSSLGLGTTA
jgi:hypothetical protein